jgi:hypothetical protein
MYKGVGPWPIDRRHSGTGFIMIRLFMVAMFLVPSLSQAFAPLNVTCSLETDIPYLVGNQTYHMYFVGAATGPTRLDAKHQLKLQICKLFGGDLEDCIPGSMSEGFPTFKIAIDGVTVKTAIYDARAASTHNLKAVAVLIKRGVECEDQKRSGGRQ